MHVQLGSHGQPGFDEPIALMKDCHRRIESFLGVLRDVTDQSAGRSLNPQQRSAAQWKLRYFRDAAPHHIADEETSLFPRLRVIDDQSLNPVLQHAEKLEAQHREAEQLHARVASHFTDWLRREVIDEPSMHNLQNDLQSLQALYQEHIAFEDDVLFVEADNRLNQQQKRQIGREMALRRSVHPQ